MVTAIIVESGLEWARVLSGRKVPRVAEAPFVYTRFAPEEPL
jgi:hypothetical protein